ncbi:hypothetical protein A8H31_03300 [Burkholderia thailandensis]|nr:hypothetical protein A8H31_03300 [Burkholderia thailandensis]NOK40908.1 hypothetical protein [Burkholderia thailandensis]NOK53421.1 hypothetical protein [Burkholderia thailandensis]PNE71663.1 hypothetical protein A8H38_05650 [Burkholderia thailandensis]
MSEQSAAFERAPVAIAATATPQTFACADFAAKTARKRPHTQAICLLPQQSQRNHRPVFPESKWSFM